MKTSEKVLISLVIILTLAVAYLLVQCFLGRAQLEKSNKIIKDQQINEKTVVFLQLFIDKVLSGQAEVSFEDRLQLENSVRDINDQEIFDQWQKFVKGGADQERQKNLARLLKLLVTKISY